MYAEFPYYIGNCFICNAAYLLVFYIQGGGWAGKKLQNYNVKEDDVLEHFKDTLVAKKKSRLVSG